MLKNENIILKIQVSLDGDEQKDDALHQLITDEVNHMRYNIETALKEYMQHRIQWELEK